MSTLGRPEPTTDPGRLVRSARHRVLVAVRITALLLALVTASRAGAPLPAIGLQGDRLPVTLEGPPPGPHYVGQAIPVRVVVTAAATEPTIEVPSHPDIDVIAAGGDVRPVSAGAIGAVSHETNLYRSDFLLVPRRAGPLVLPAFRARVDGHTGASGPIRLDPRQPPGFGRPAWFLGGIGPLEVGLVARPDAIRLGDSLVVEVRLTGPGALGSTARPTLRAPEGAVLGTEDEPLPSTASAAPPSRTFPYRVRPTTAGRLALAPVLVSWFDPASRAYRTVGSAGLSVRVDDPPRFDPRAIEVAAIDEEAAGTGSEVERIGWGLGTLGAMALVAALAAIGRSWAHRRRSSPRRYAARQAIRLRASTGLDRAELAADSLAGYLSRAVGRTEGELTPPEAHDAVGEATGDPILADRASRLIIACDAIRYSGGAVDGAPMNVLGDAPGFFRDLARADRPSIVAWGRTIDPPHP